MPVQVVQPWLTHVQTLTGINENQALLLDDPQGRFAQSSMMRQMIEKRYDRKDDPFMAGVQNWVKIHLFKKVKFIGKDSDLDHSTSDGSICKQLLDHLNLSGDDAVNFWNRYRYVIRHELNKRRNTCQDQMKKIFLSKCKGGNE